MMTLDNLISVLGLCLTSVALGFALGYALGQIHAKNLLTKVKPFLNFFYKISLYNLRTLNRPLILTAYYYFIA